MNISVIVDGSMAINEIEKYFKNKKINIQSIKKDDKVIKNKKLQSFTFAATFDSKKLTKEEIIGKLITKDNIVEVIDENNVIQ